MLYRTLIATIKPFFFERSFLAFYKHAFLINKKNAKQLILMAFIVLGNFFRSCMILVINAFISQFFVLLSLPGFSYLSLIFTCTQFAVAFFIYSFSAAANQFLSNQLIYHLNHLMTDNLVSRWLESKAYYGFHIFSFQNITNPATILSNDIQEVNRLSVTLFSGFLNVFFNFLVGLYGLWQLSLPFSFQIASMVFVIPGYMVIAAIIYAVGYNLIVHTLGQQLHQTIKSQQEIASKLEEQIHHVRENAPRIELLQASGNEKRFFFKIFKKNHIFEKISTRLETGLAFFIAMNEQLGYFIGILLCVPQMIAKTITIEKIYLASEYFTYIIGPITWRHDYYQDLANLDVRIDKLQDYKKEIARWERIKNSQSVIFSTGEAFAIDNLVVKKPDGEIILAERHFQFHNNKVTLIQGPSGVGKSTLFLALTGLWPFVRGKITLPVNKPWHVISQRPFFPLNSSLYEAIVYPQDFNLIPEKKAEIDALLLEFGFNATMLQEAVIKKDWSKHLSGGEQQRIALIRAINNKPELLLMDEPFSGLDEKLKKLCKALLKKYLPNATIIYIDHDSLQPDIQNITTMYDYRVILENKKLTEIRETDQRIPTIPVMNNI